MDEIADEGEGFKEVIVTSFDLLLFLFDNFCL